MLPDVLRTGGAGLDLALSSQVIDARLYDVAEILAWQAVGNL